MEVTPKIRFSYNKLRFLKNGDTIMRPLMLILSPAMNGFYFTFAPNYIISCIYIIGNGGNSEDTFFIPPNIPSQH